MAKFTLEITDLPDEGEDKGRVNIVLAFDPPLDAKALSGTPAQLVGVDLIEHLSKMGPTTITKVSEDPNG